MLLLLKRGTLMNRFASLLAMLGVLLTAGVADAQCCGQAVTTTYYAPTTAYYAPAPAAPVYYAPAPTTVYYAAPPAAVYYQRPLVGAGITRVGYAPVTYIAPAAYTTNYSPWWW
jgi:hypothetical protein